MLPQFSSLRRKMLFYSTALFCIPLFVCISFSYIYLHRENINNQYLMQQNMLIMCMQELKNNIFFSKISELSNLSIIRNELYRMYRIVDMSLYAPNHRDSYHAIAPQTTYPVIPNKPDQVGTNDPLLQEQMDVMYADGAKKTATDRLVLYNHLRQMQSLGFTSFSVNIKDERLNLFINESNRALLGDLYSDRKSLYDHLYHEHTPEDGYFLILRRKDAPTSAGNQNPSGINDSSDTSMTMLIDNATYQGHNTAASSGGDALRLAGTAESSSFNPQPLRGRHARTAINEYENEEEERFLPQNSITNEILRRSIDLNGNSNGVLDEYADHSADATSYLSIVAPLSFTKDQLLVIITDITKLQQQDNVLKRLIANSLNDLVLSISLTTPLSITLIDDKMQPLAGDLSEAEIRRLITPQVLFAASEQEMFQGYNKHWGHYLTVGHFKPYNWYLLINSDNVRAHSMLWQYMLILFMSGFVLAVISVHILGALCEKDAKEVGLIANKIKHMATLFQDPSLLNRVCDGLPRREDEIGVLAANVRLLSQTMYQSIQDVLHNTELQGMDQGERNIIIRLRQTPINREIYLKEYYKNRFNVHTEMAPHSNSDFYDVLELSESKLAIFVGSVNEEGIEAANISNLNICLIRQMLRLSHSMHLSLPTLISEVNNNIADNNPKNILTSLCVVIIDQRTGKFEYLNAGHTLPILYHKKQGFEYIDVRTGPVLGRGHNQNFNSITLQLEDKDSLIFYTDGLLDCTNRRLEKLGQYGFENMLHDESFNNATDTVNNLVQKLKRYTRDATLAKDYTIACYQFYANTTAPSPHLKATKSKETSPEATSTTEAKEPPETEAQAPEATESTSKAPDEVKAKEAEATEAHESDSSDEDKALESEDAESTQGNYANRNMPLMGSRTMNVDPIQAASAVLNTDISQAGTSLPASAQPESQKD